MPSLLNILSILILFQLGLMVLFLFTSRKGKTTSNRLLACFFFLLFVNIVDGLFAVSGFYTRYPALAHLEDGFVFLIGPVLYFYTLSMVFKDFRLTRNDIVHLLPFIVITAGYQLYYHLQTEEYQKLIQRSITHQTLPTGFYVSVFFIYLHVSTYLFYSFRSLTRYRRQLRDRFSNIERINLNWLFFMLISVAVVLLASAAYTFLPVLGLREYFPLVFSLAFVFLFVFSSLVVWKGLRQPELFSGLPLEPASDKRYSTPLLSDLEKQDLQQRLNTMMRRQKPYLNPDLSLDQLADMAGTSPKKLSQCVNEVFKQNFFDYINTYRIEEAKLIFQTASDPRITVLEVMYQSGFNSKSSFNTLFRQKTGLTPSAYKQGIRSAHQP